MQEKNQETVFGLDFACLQIKEFSFNKAESTEGIFLGQKSLNYSV